MRTLLCAAALSVGLLPAVANAELIYGLNAFRQVTTFDSANPSVALSRSAITGFAAGETLLSLDLRPATGGLYALGQSGNLYLLEKEGATYSGILIGDTGIDTSALATGLDFNPVVDRLRYVDLFGNNLRINPDSAALTTDTPIAPFLNLVAAGYSNNLAGAATTTLYGITVNGRLVSSTAPNTGVYTEVGPLGVLLPANPQLVNFDISGPTGVAYLSSDRNFYTVNLGTGAATLVGQFPNLDFALRGMTAAGAAAGVAPVPEPSAWALLIAGFGLVGTALRRRRAQRLMEA